MEELSNMDITKFKMMSYENLKLFLFLQKKSVEGNYDTLVARYVIYTFFVCF